MVQTGLESSCLCLTCAGIISKRHRVHLIFTFLNLANSPSLIPPIPFLGLMEPVVTGPAYPMYDNKEALLRNAEDSDKVERTSMELGYSKMSR